MHPVRLSRMIPWAALVALVALPAPLPAAGGVGHCYVARLAIARLVQSRDVPAELRQALADPVCANAYCNGAIAPDLSCLVDSAHYGHTGRLPAALIDAAESAFTAARRLPDHDPAKPAKLQEALKGLCFACGWLSHCATDVTVHPKVNSRAGDAYEFGSTAQIGIHTAAEVQITRYLTATIHRPVPKISFDLPYWLVEKASGCSEKQLKDSVRLMRAKLIGEAGLAGQVVIPLAELTKEWAGLVEQSVSESVRYVADPDAFRDYGLDYGAIGTTEFRELRQECVGINGGAVPEAWGRQYMAWWEIVRGMAPGPRHDKLVELIKGRPSVVGRQVTVKAEGAINAVWLVNGVRLTLGQQAVVRLDRGILRVQVAADTGGRWLCTNARLKGTNPRIIERSPYGLHYTSTVSGRPFEYHHALLSESYTWTVYKGSGRAISSGAHANVGDDVYEWTLPPVQPGPDGKPQQLSLSCQADLRWRTAETGKTTDTRQETTNLGVSVYVMGE